MVQTRFRVLLILVALMAAISSVAMSRSVFAQQSGNVVVTADVSSAITLKVCDTTADFGRGLTALGGTPVGTNDHIIKSARGDRSLKEGTIYIWFPTCSPGQALLEVESTVPWALHNCATENSGSSSLRLGTDDLGWGFVDPTQSAPSYADADGNFHFRSGCQPPITGGGNGLYRYHYSYKLRVDVSDSAGSFASTTTWMAVT